MSARIASSRISPLPLSFRVLRHGNPQPAANDNAHPRTSDRLLGDALKHFARYGLGAAEIARDNAERAFFAGDRQTYRHWLDVCRTLDRRMAAAIAAHHPQR